MRTNKFQKIVAIILLFCQFSFWPFLAYADVLGISTPLTPTYVNDGVSNAIADAPILTAIHAASIANQACLVGDQTATAATTAARVSLSGLDIITGGTTLQATLLTEIGQLEAAINCHEAVLTALQAIPPGIMPDSLTQNQMNLVTNSANTAIAALNTKLESVNNQLEVAQSNIWKALLITILLNTTKVVADQLVTKLVNSYKISNIKAYTDSVATLMYDNQFLRDNFPNSQDQAMARQILTNPILRANIQPGIYMEANAALGFTPNTLSPSDPNYYTKMASVGSSNANPYFLQTAFVAGVDASHGNAVVTAQRTISQGSGYKAPVNCAGSLAQQKQIDTQTAASQTLINNDQQILLNLQNSNASPAAIKQAQANLTTAQSNWNNIPFAVTGQNGVAASQQGGGNNTEGTAAIIMCEAVSSPAVLVNQGIDAVFKSLNLGQYNNANLPGALSAISSMATQIGSSLVLGGIANGSVSINENQAINAGVTATAQIAAATYSANMQANLAKGISLQISSNTSVTNGYQIDWTVTPAQIPNASYVTIVGPAITGPATHLPLSGTYAIVSATTGTYLLTVYSSTGQNLATASETNSPTQQSYNFNSNGPQVAGAFTAKPAISPRGPALALSPRGQ